MSRIERSNHVNSCSARLQGLMVAIGGVECAFHLLADRVKRRRQTVSGAVDGEAGSSVSASRGDGSNRDSTPGTKAVSQADFGAQASEVE